MHPNISIFTTTIELIHQRLFKEKREERWNSNNHQKGVCLILSFILSFHIFGLPVLNQKAPTFNYWDLGCYENRALRPFHPPNVAEHVGRYGFLMTWTLNKIELYKSKWLMELTLRMLLQWIILFSRKVWFLKFSQHGNKNCVQCNNGKTGYVYFK